MNIRLHDYVNDTYPITKTIEVATQEEWKTFLDETHRGSMELMTTIAGMPVFVECGDSGQAVVNELLGKDNVWVFADLMEWSSSEDHYIIRCAVHTAS